MSTEPPIRFKCPSCGARHERGYVDGVSLFRCLHCGYQGTKNADEDFDPRTEADAQIARALQIVCDADGADDGRGRRNYTDEELDTMFFALTAALVQLKKVPGGLVAHDRYYEKCRAELRRRGLEKKAKTKSMRLRMKVWTDTTTGKRYLMPVALMRNLHSNVMAAHAMTDEDTKLIKLTGEEWDALPYFYFKEDGDAPRASAVVPDIVDL